MGDTPTRLDRLTVLRDSQERTLAGDLPSREFAALSREYRATLAEIADLEPKESAGDGIDEIARRRAARRTSTPPRQGRAQRTS